MIKQINKSLTKYLLVALSLAVVCLVALDYARAHAEEQHPTSPYRAFTHPTFFMRLVPCIATRAQVKALHPKQIVKLSVYGPDYLHFENDPIEIKDHKIINQLLEALKHAEIPDNIGTANQADTILIYVKPLKKSDDPLQFQFNPRVPASCFGPLFFQALRHIKEQSINAPRARKG